jgi:hypothetical protein
MRRFRKALKHWLVPHKHNDHRPHLIRGHGLAVMGALILGVQASAFAIHSAPTPLVRGGHVLAYATGSITPVELFTLTNQQRAANGLPALRLDSRLNQSSYLKAQNMFAEDYWAHVSPSGIQPWHWFTQAGYPYTYAGENLAKDFDTAAGVMDGWMNSPGHRANVLNVNYKDVGFTVQDGTLVGGQTTLVVAHYGATAPTTAPAVASAAPKPSVKSAATPASTPVPTPTPIITPSPTPTPITPSPTPSPTHSATSTAQSQSTPGAPEPQSYSLFRPLSLLRTLDWRTLATIGLLFILLLVYVFTHITVWRKGLARWRTRHYRLYAAAQISGLSIAILVLSTSGFGQVG